ncbi:MAG: VOC family protein [Candidatus Thermoplasmatota archaeon]|nr:VOC family protein [Candidatus Thermoplasmatota archaeon]
MTFSHVSIRASDMDRSIAFYMDLLGMELERRRAIPKNRAEIAFLKDPGGGFSLELTHYEDQNEFQQADYMKRTFDHLAFKVGDLRDLVARVKEAGFTVTDEPFELSPGHWLAFIEDPDGTLIELIQE